VAGTDTGPAGSAAMDPGSPAAATLVLTSVSRLRNGVSSSNRVNVVQFLLHVCRLIFSVSDVDVTCIIVVSVCFILK